jgi:hypothetical protein
VGKAGNEQRREQQGRQDGKGSHRELAVVSLGSPDYITK